MVSVNVSVKSISFFDLIVLEQIDQWSSCLAFGANGLVKIQHGAPTIFRGPLTLLWGNTSLVKFSRNIISANMHCKRPISIISSLNPFTLNQCWKLCLKFKSPALTCSRLGVSHHIYTFYMTENISSQSSQNMSTLSKITSLFPLIVLFNLWHNNPFMMSPLVGGASPHG